MQMVLVIYYLETYIGSIIDWKHQTDWNHTKSLGKKVHQKHSFGNNEIRLETKSGVSKQEISLLPMWSFCFRYHFFIYNVHFLFPVVFFVANRNWFQYMFPNCFAHKSPIRQNNTSADTLICCWIRVINQNSSEKSAWKVT